MIISQYTICKLVQLINFFILFTFSLIFFQVLIQRICSVCPGKKIGKKEENIYYIKSRLYLIWFLLKNRHCLIWQEFSGQGAAQSRKAQLIVAQLQLAQGRVYQACDALKELGDLTYCPGIVRAFYKLFNLIILKCFSLQG